MSSLPKVLLHTVVRVSDTSVFLVPKEGETLNFRTVNSAPPAHRDVLQRNGLIAKVCIAVESVSETNDSNCVQPPRVANDAEEGRRLWRDALAHTKLLHPAVGDLRAPIPFEEEPWPILSIRELETRMSTLSARHENDEVNTSSYCVPSIAIQRLVYRAGTLRATVGVVWMPMYKQNLSQWAEARMAAMSRPLAEGSIVAMLQQVTGGVMSVEKTVLARGQGANSRDTHCGHPAGLDPDSILVHEADGEAAFSLAFSPLALSAKQRSLCAKLSQSRFKQLSLLPYLAPEQVQPPQRPVLCSQRCAVWALGVIALALGNGTPTLASQLKWQNRRSAELPINHPSLTPDAIVARLRRDLAGGGYSAGFVGLVGLLLSQDHLTRPTLRTADRILQDLNRTIPIHRFPFALGDISLLRVPQPDSVQLNPSAHRYVTKDACCYCKQPRNKAPCRNREHAPAVASPSWAGDELLPGFHVEAGRDAGASERTRMSYLYPLAPSSLEDKEKKKLLTQAVQGHKSTRAAVSGDGSCQTSTRAAAGDGDVSGMPTAASTVPATGTTVNTSMASTGLSAIAGGESVLSAAADAPTIAPASLFQLFGGFAAYRQEEKGRSLTTADKDRAVALDVLVPFPTKGLRRCERTMMGSVAELGFTAALPWPSCCTATLQKKGRICSQVPAVFGGLAHYSGSSATSTPPTSAAVTAVRDVRPKYFAWICPKESFVLENECRWTPAPEGGFVFWFHDSLEPSDMDRYFAVTAIRSCTINARVAQTVLPDQVFRKHVGEEQYQLNATHLRLGRSVSHQLLSSRHHTPRAMSASISASCLARRRSSLNITLVDVPTGKTIYEEDPGIAPQRRSHIQSRVASPARLPDLSGGVPPPPSGGTAPAAPAEHRVTPPLPTLTSYEEGIPHKHAQRKDPATEERGLARRQGSTTDASGSSVDTHRRGACTAAAGTRASEQTRARRRSRRTLTAAQRKERMAAPKMTVVDDVACTSPIVEAAAATHTGLHPLNTTEVASASLNAAAAPQSAPAAGGLACPLLAPVRGRTSRVPNGGKARMTAQANAETQSPPAPPAPLASLSVNKALSAGAGAGAANMPVKSAESPMNVVPARQASSGVGGRLPAVAARRPFRVGTPCPGLPSSSSSAAAYVPMAAESSRPQGPCTQQQRNSGCQSAQESFCVPHLSLTPIAKATHPFVSYPFSGLTSPASATATGAAVVSIFGRWLPAGTVDAPFDSLTFYVPRTHEHGSLQPPVAVSSAARQTLHCPDTAIFMSFMANKSPLLRRNHQVSDDSCEEMLLPHHGFAFYAADGTLVASLALRCGPAGSVDMDPDDEFPIVGKPAPTRMGIAAASRHYYASYFSLADTPHYCHSLTPPVSPSHQTVHLRHLNGAVGPLMSPQDPQMLTFSSARRLIGELTPSGSPAATEFLLDVTTDDVRPPPPPLTELSPDTLLPVCWLGYDAENGALVFSSLDHALWHPLLIC